MNNETVNVKIFTLDRVPTYQSPGASGIDLHARLEGLVAEGKVTVNPGEQSKIATGLWMQIPFGYEGQVRPRSGLAWKNRITCLNAPGTIDCDYRGEISVLIYNAGTEPFEVKDGDRIAQLVICPVVQALFTQVRSLEDLSETERGAGGFGSTGVSAATALTDGVQSIARPPSTVPADALLAVCIDQEKVEFQGVKQGKTYWIKEGGEHQLCSVWDMKGNLLSHSLKAERFKVR